ncbi:aminotransferase class III-fold pyridoxal phosphate-dependent enzyme [Candidatus Pelagibacter sp.]|nr:aminotransferase class III-fold pyridoxal phosphate-dependent enzyme [Candidatus Pelagibacter sp.]
MPFTSNKDFKANPRLITEAKGVYLKTHHGKTQIDASSGLFCNPLGHGRKEITEAVTKQLETLDYAQPFQQGFGGSFELASRIAKHTPGDLNKMFFTICGSTAVETAIKIAVAYHRAKGNAQRTGREVCEKLKDLIPRHNFMIPVQAAIGGKIIARETIKGFKKDVLTKIHGGGATDRKRKLLEKQKKGKARSKQFGRVEIPQEAFIGVLKIKKE